MKLNDPLTKLIFSLIVWLKLYYQKIINIIKKKFFRKDILDSLFDGYDAWIPPSFDKSKYFAPPPSPPIPIPVKMIT